MLVGAMRFRSPTSSIRSSTATLLSLRRNQAKNSWVFASSSNLLPCVTALHVTLTRSWHHFRHLHWMFNFLALCLDCSWSPNARTYTSQRNRGFAALHRLYKAAGFSESDLHGVSIQTDSTLPSCFTLVKMSAPLIEVLDLILIEYIQNLLTSYLSNSASLLNSLRSFDLFKHCLGVDCFTPFPLVFGTETIDATPWRPRLL